MALHPALDIADIDGELLLAFVDDFSPTAADDHDGLLTIFFSSVINRDQAGAAVTAAYPGARVIIRDVDDGDWARRSQQNLQPVRVGRIVVAPPWSDLAVASGGFGSPAVDSGAAPAASRQDPAFESTMAGLPSSSDILLIIEPSMGFGTGHHATTRLCLAALQTVDLTGLRVLDIGTGSGVLAIAARRLGAGEVWGLDSDADAIQSANENLALNPGIDGVTFSQADLRVALASSNGERAAVATANLTGALLVRSAGVLIDAIRLDGLLILSGLMGSERAEVSTAFASRTELVSITSEEEWVALVLRKSR